MSDVSVIGLGVMGFALAAAFVRDGKKVTVWNRTVSKAVPLEAQGATVAINPAAAIGASPTIIFCVNDYDVTAKILTQSGCVEALAGKTLVQLSTGTPQDARSGQAFAERAGALYLDGAVMDYPDQIGTPEAVLFMAGPTSVYTAVEAQLKTLGGATMHVGDAIGAASALDCAALSASIGVLLGVIHGARICETEGIPVDRYGELVLSLLPVLGAGIGDLASRIASENHDDTHAALGTYAQAAQRILSQAHDRGLDTSFPDYATSLLKRAEAAGMGEKDISALMTVVRESA